ncbi:gamma-glutamylcyclotransferase family protein [Yoonia sp.]|uniref:gamma-glutamylcyclotransferase family protein n=1 Tax=Yoonia sp. TaxID=2212373 RepID=UPI0019DF58D7|nr:gamma-glutamylcyclotransferase family protein [Yoonia sp.]MBE0413605.1 gamma-glutamylcyclotransferase [Yoonia sp.]
MSDPAFFGYGSLVNLATHVYADPRPARLQGWRRVWRHTRLREVAFLSVEPDPASVIYGVVARVPGADWLALDAREAAYVRHDVSRAVLHDGPNAPTAVYQVSPHHVSASGGDHPILRSYLDVVVQGYLRMYGAQGVAHFFATTAGWDTRVHDDRSNPVYPRHQKLTQAETALVDHHLAQVNV